MRFRVSDSRVAMSEERHEQKSAMVASVPKASARNFNEPRASLWMLLISLCLVIFDAVFVVDADNCSCKSQYLAKGSEDCRVDDSHWWYEEGGGDKEDTEADEQDGKNILVLQNWLERIRKEVTNKVFSIKRISEFLNFPILAQPTLKKI